MTPRVRQRVGLASFAAVVVAGMVFLAITAAEGASAVTLPLPSVEHLVVGLITILFEEMLRRGLKKIDQTHDRVGKIDVALRGYDGNGGALGDIARLQEDVSDLQRGRPVAPPPGFAIASRTVARAE